MNPTLLLAYWAVIFTLIAIPGPDWAFIVALGSRRGNVLAGAGGLFVGYSAVGALVAVGVGALVARSEPLLALLTGAGAVFLVYIGIGILRGAPSSPSLERPEEPRRRESRHGDLVSGVAVSMLNPKGLLIMVALLPQFADTTADWPLPAQLAVLGLVFAATCGAFYIVLGFATRAVLRRWGAASKWISALSGITLIVLGGALLAEQVIRWT
ncbi:LysE family transporter [Nocardiopsis rhodophaea]|uniref:LysE family transporter n=1 Tax=Nocardiopsis rhodophaea TaxID=280238 RepID=A0ABN2T7V6_9ACTN